MTSPDPDQPAAPPAPPRSGLGWRLITAAVGIPVLLGLILVGGPVFAVVVAAALVIGCLEFARALKLTDIRVIAVAAATVAALAVAALRGDDAVTAVLSGGVVASLIVLVIAGEIPARLPEWALSLAAVLYVGWLGQHVVGLRELPDGRDWVLLAFFTTFATDTGAYAVGRLLGRHKLAPALSPGKTIEGAIGGLVAGALAAWALSVVLGLDQPLVAMLALGAAAAVAGQAGDLAESLIKRSAGVKDMGTLLPGHGGILDRLDSLLFVLPLVYYAARWWLT
ncbi:MAG: phosphatidate cytidylyltransferase [Dehalococcoidia bacterium]